jgi:hypothetical protein
VNKGKFKESTGEEKKKDKEQKVQQAGRVKRRQRI